MHCSGRSRTPLVQVRRLGEELRRSVLPAFFFPERRHIRILIDSERLLHTDEATRALAEFGICPMADWPKHSPDMNPQENVWSWTEKALRQGNI